MKGGKYTKILAKIQVRRIFRTRDIGRNVLPKIIKICGDAMLVPTWMGTNMADRSPKKTSVAEFWYKSVNLFLEELINIAVILFLIHNV